MKLIDFAEIVGKLKNLKRTGWVNHQIPNPESVAEHSYRMAVLAAVLAPTMSVDQGRAIIMCLIHDLGEAEIGDLVMWVGRVKQSDNDDKYIAERKALVSILSLADADNLISVYDEYVQNETKEAKFVRELGNLETAIQAYEYEKTYKMNLQEFFEHAHSAIQGPVFNDVLTQIEALRKPL